VRQVGGDAKSNPPAMAAPFERSHALHPFSARAQGCWRRADAASSFAGARGHRTAGASRPHPSTPSNRHINQSISSCTSFLTRGIRHDSIRHEAR
jgi:hypothetical protein